MINGFVRIIDRITEIFGQILSLLIVVMVLCTVLVVILRYGLAQGSIALQESLTYMHGAVFLLGAAYTLKVDQHVRVDIFYRRFSLRTKVWVNAIGMLVFLMPVALFIFFASLDYVHSSWQAKEISVEPGGLPFVYLLKSLIPLMALNLFLQSIVEFIRNANILVSSS